MSGKGGLPLLSVRTSLLVLIRDLVVAEDEIS